jgi:hypothetical protein
MVHIMLLLIHAIIMGLCYGLYMSHLYPKLLDEALWSFSIECFVLVNQAVSVNIYQNVFMLHFIYLANVKKLFLYKETYFLEIVGNWI